MARFRSIHVQATYFLALSVNPFSINWRIASGRVVSFSCVLIQVSSFARTSGCSRTRIGIPLPVGGGPLFFFRDITD